MLEVVSLFSGCGGMDLGFTQAGYKIIWGVDIDKYATLSYNANFDTPIINEDLNNININDIPDHNVLIGGFPCQPFSMMGKQKGFEDERGTLFFKISEILRIKQPNIIVLENVRNLMTHDNKKTFIKMKDILENELGYKIYAKVLNSSNYGVPQTRNRVFVIGFKDKNIDFEFPKSIPLNITMQDLLEKNVDEKYFLSEKLLKTVMSWGTKGYSAKPEIDLKIARPLCATMHKMHRASQDNYVTENGRVRRLTPRECARLQGFPEDYKIIVSDVQAYKQFGNAVTVNVAYSVANVILESISKSKGV